MAAGAAGSRLRFARGPCMPGSPAAAPHDAAKGTRPQVQDSGGWLEGNRRVRRRAPAGFHFHFVTRELRPRPRRRSHARRAPASSSRAAAPARAQRERGPPAHCQPSSRNETRTCASAAAPPCTVCPHPLLLRASINPSPPSQSPKHHPCPQTLYIILIARRTHTSITTPPPPPNRNSHASGISFGKPVRGLSNGDGF
jgi:hypothetical protein